MHMRGGWCSIRLMESDGYQLQKFPPGFAYLLPSAVCAVVTDTGKLGKELADLRLPGLRQRQIPQEAGLHESLRSPKWHCCHKPELHLEAPAPL